MSKQKAVVGIRKDDIFSESDEDEIVSLVRGIQGTGGGIDADDESTPNSISASPFFSRKLVKFKPTVAISIVEEGLQNFTDNDNEDDF